MRRNRSSQVLFGLLCFSLVPNLVMSLPSQPETVAGSGEVSRPDAKTMVIEAGDKSILRYQQFNIGADETVRFVQPDAKSVVLNRIAGPGRSDILGKLESNGRVFLINPDGVYFGPDSVVNMGSLVTSVLDIADSDFLSGNFAFSGNGSNPIINAGTLSVSDEGSIVFLSDDVRNEGTILAKTGKVLMLSGEKVTLDFSGDGLMSFAVETLADTSILGGKGAVKISRFGAGQVVRDLINIDGVAIGSEIVEEQGKIILTASSKIVAKEVAFVGTDRSVVTVSGTVDASSETIGGSIYAFGETIALQEATLDASGAFGGGRILLGGDAFGQGPYAFGKTVNVSPGVSLLADATVSGHGGKIVVWSNDVTTFNGSASARGSAGGNGGFVETSGRLGLALATGKVDTSSLGGKAGSWLLDPYAIVIASGGDATLTQAANGGDLTSVLTIDPSVLASASSNVVLNAPADGGSITIAENTVIDMANGYGITFMVDSQTGDIFLQNGAGIITDGGDIVFDGKVTLLGDTVSLQTPGSLKFLYELDGSASALSDLSLQGGSVVLTGAAGARSPLGALSIQADMFNPSSDIFTKGQNVVITGATVLTGDVVIDATYGGAYSGADIVFAGEQSSIDGPYGLTIESGSGRMEFGGSIGSAKTLRSFKPKGALAVLSGDCTTDGNTQIYESPVVVTGNTAFTDNGTSGIYFLSTLDGDGTSPWTVTVSAPIGTAYFTGIVGGGTPLGALTVSASQIVQVDKVVIANGTSANSALSYSAPGGIHVGGDITTGVAGTSIGTITFNNSTVFSANAGTSSVATAGVVTLTASSGSGGSAAPSTVAFNGVSVGSGNLVVTTGSYGVVTLSNASVNLVSLSITADSITQDANSAIFASGNITLDPSGGNNVKTLSTAAAINTTSGTVTLKGGASVASVASNIGAGSGNIVLTPTGNIPISYSGVIQTAGGTVTANASAGTQDLLLTGNASIDVGDGSVTLHKVDGAHTLSIAGSNVASLSLASALGGVTPLSGLTAGIGSITQSGAVSITSGSLNYVALLGVSLAANITTTTSGSISITGPVSLTGAGTRTLTSAGNISFSGDTSTIDSSATSSLTLQAGSGGVVTLGGAVGSVNPIGALTVNAGTSVQVNIASNITAAGSSAIVFTPAVNLTGPSTITSGSGAVTFSSTVNGTQPLNITTTGTVTFGGIVGGIDYLGGLNVAAGSIAVNTTVVNAVGGGVIFNGPVILGSGGATITDYGNGVSLLGNITGASGTPALTVNATTGIIRLGGTINNTVGAVTLNGLTVEQIGSITPLGNSSVTFTGSNSIIVSNNITVSGSGALTMNNPISIGTNVTFTSGTGAITLAGVLSGSDTLNISAGSTVALSGAPYTLSSLSGTAVGTITVAAASPITTTGLLNLVSSGGSVVTNAGLISQAGNITLNGSTGLTLNANTNISTTGGNISLTGAVSYAGGTISTGNGNLTVANALTLSGPTAVNIGSGVGIFSSTIAGGSNSLSINGSNIGSLTFSGAVSGVTTLLAQMGYITQGSTVSTSGNISYSAAVSNSIGGNITSSGGSVTILGPTTLTGAVTVTTTNQNISFSGSSSTIDGAVAFAVSAGTGNIRFDGAVGSNKALTTFATTGTGTTLIGASITTTGTQTYGASLNTGNILLTGDSTISTTNSAVTFNGTINGPSNLFVNAGASTVTYNGAVGATTPLASIDTIAGGGITVKASIKTR